MALVARGVGVAYDGSRRILSDVSLELREGEVLAILGPNGAGKTTLLRALSGIVRPSSGKVTLDDRDLAAIDRRTIARSIGVVPQELAPIEGFTVREVVAMGRAPHQGHWLRANPNDAAIVDEAMRACSIEALADRPITALSGGERKRAIVAQALAQRPKVLLLDEAATFLDLRHAIAIFDVVSAEAKKGIAVAAILHDLALARRYADRVALLVAGELIAIGPPNEVMTEPLLGRAFGVELRGLRDDAGDVVAFAPLRTRT